MVLARDFGGGMAGTVLVGRGGKEIEWAVGGKAFPL